MSLLKDNHFDVLNVNENSSDRDIKLAYTKKLREYPLEKFPEEFKKINKAKEVLLDSEKKAAYINELYNTDSWEDLLDEGYAEFKKNRMYSAKQILDEMLNQNYGKEMEVLIFAVRLYEHENNLNKSNNFAMKLEKIHSKNPVAISFLREYYYAIKKYDKAMQLAEKQYSLNNNDVEATLYLIDLYFEFNTKNAEEFCVNYFSSFKVNIQKFPIINRVFMNSMEINNVFLVKKMEHYLKEIAKTNSKHKLLENMIEIAGDLSNKFYGYKYYVSLIDELNEEEFSNIKNAVRELKSYILNMSYFDVQKQNSHSANSMPRSTIQETTTSHTVPGRNQRQEEQEFDNANYASYSPRGSILFSIIWGVIIWLATSSFIMGVISGIVWFFFGNFLKKLLKIIIWIVVIVAIIGFFLN